MYRFLQSFFFPIHTEASFIFFNENLPSMLSSSSHFNISSRTLVSCPNIGRKPVHESLLLNNGGDFGPCNRVTIPISWLPRGFTHRNCATSETERLQHRTSFSGTDGLPNLQARLIGGAVRRRELGLRPQPRPKPVLSCSGRLALRGSRPVGSAGVRYGSAG